MKSLVVEDDVTSSLLLQEILKHYGSVITAVDGHEALSQVNNALNADEPFDLICLDLMMPGMDGLETLRTIRAAESEKGVAWVRRQKVVIITARQDLASVITAYKSFCDAYLVKPIEKAKLLEHLRTLGLIN
ncbi:MAG: response regulator [Deltaproteobacteria bacterium]|nr:response regulator [Deltaproteobacteria bacterium]